MNQLNTNHKPVIRGTDNAIWRRIRLIPFQYTIPEFLQEKDFPKKLVEELPSILNWALEGCLKWQEEGLDPPDEVILATNSYRGEMDVLGAFLEECCVREPSYEVSSKELYGKYKEWAEANGERVMTNTQFGRLLNEREFEKYRQTAGSKLIMYKGITLNGK